MKKMTAKDFILISLLSALYIVIYMIGMTVATLFGPIGHSFTTGLAGLFTGPVIYFISRKVGKMWQFTILSAVLMAVTALMGGGYLPWLLTTMTGAIIADFLASRSNKPKIATLALASGIMHVGQSLGAVLPAVLFLEKFRSDWIARGQSAEYMDTYIQYITGISGFLALVLTFVLSAAGVYLGHLFLNKHFNQEAKK